VAALAERASVRLTPPLMSFVHRDDSRACRLTMGLRLLSLCFARTLIPLLVPLCASSRNSVGWL
jgi:hypothetical protein